MQGFTSGRALKRETGARSGRHHSRARDTASSARLVVSRCQHTISACRSDGVQYNVLATDIYKQASPAELSHGTGLSACCCAAGRAFLLRRPVRASAAKPPPLARAVPYQPKPAQHRRLAFVACGIIAGSYCHHHLHGIFASSPHSGPYNLSRRSELQLQRHGTAAAGRVSSLAANWRIDRRIRHQCVFVGASLVARPGLPDRPFYPPVLCVLPSACGIVLGLGYIFFFNSPSIRALHLTHDDHSGGVPDRPFLLGRASEPLTALSSSMARSRRFPPRCGCRSSDLHCGELPVLTSRRCWTSPCTCSSLRSRPYSAVVFLYSPQTALASIAVLNMDDAGRCRTGRAMAMTISRSDAGTTIYTLGARGVLTRHSPGAGASLAPS